jgi:hypothetical protein
MRPYSIAKLAKQGWKAQEISYHINANHLLKSRIKIRKTNGQMGRWQFIPHGRLLARAKAH